MIKLLKKRYILILAFCCVAFMGILTIGAQDIEGPDTEETTQDDQDSESDEQEDSNDLTGESVLEEEKLDKEGTQTGAPSFYSDGNITYARSSTRIKLSSSDRISSLERIEYKVDDSEYKIYTEPINIPEEGQHQVSYRAFDVVGNMEFENTATMIIDDTPPVSSIASNVSFIKINENIFVPGKGNPALSIKATDFYSGVKLIEYYIEDGESEDFQKYSEPIPLDSPGTKVIVYRATDNLGNVAGSKRIRIITDSTPPTVQIKFTQRLIESGGKRYSLKNNKVDLSASDEGSGVAAIYIKLGVDEGFQPYTEPVSLSAEGEYVIEAKSMDRAGNESVIATETIIVDAEPPQTNLEFLNN